MNAAPTHVLRTVHADILAGRACMGYLANLSASNCVRSERIFAYFMGEPSLRLAPRPDSAPIATVNFHTSRAKAVTSFGVPRSCSGTIFRNSLLPQQGLTPLKRYRYRPRSARRAPACACGHFHSSYTQAGAGHVARIPCRDHERDRPCSRRF